MKINLKLITLKNITISFFLLTTLSCENDDDSVPEEEACFEHFNYDLASQEGPLNWDNYCVEVSSENQCGSIVRQSPINVVGVVNDNTLFALNKTYETTATDIFNNGHTIQFNYNNTASLNFGGINFSLLQFHFHADSEHTVNGNQYPLEVHLVHISDNGAIAVIGIFFELGAENPFLAQFTSHLPGLEDEVYENDSLEYNASDLFPESTAYFNYNGSLTTPPCSETVEWIVMEAPITASQEQLDAFANILHNNNRPIQPLNGRTIGKYSE